MSKLLILLCCTYTLASHPSHIIPVEKYETDLQDLGQHVEEHETPVKVIKITKTVAVKIPVPYPVKVIEKVPYPVHVSKPYPVKVPHIVQIPHERKVELKPKHENAGGNYEDISYDQGDYYKVQEDQSYNDSPGAVHSFPALSDSAHLGGFNYGNNQHLASHGNDYSQGHGKNSYEASVGGFHGYAGDEATNTYSAPKIYDAIKSYL